MDLFGDKLSTTHIHDNDGTCDQHHLMGEGNINFAPIFDRLKKLGLKYYISNPIATKRALLRKMYAERISLALLQDPHGISDRF